MHCFVPVTLFIALSIFQSVYNAPARRKEMKDPYKYQAKLINNHFNVEYLYKYVGAYEMFGNDLSKSYREAYYQETNCKKTEVTQASKSKACVFNMNGKVIVCEIKTTPVDIKHCKFTGDKYDMEVTTIRADLYAKMAVLAYNKRIKSTKKGNLLNTKTRIKSLKREVQKHCVSFALEFTPDKQQILIGRKNFINFEAEEKKCVPNEITEQCTNEQKPVLVDCTAVIFEPIRGEYPPIDVHCTSSPSNGVKEQGKTAKYSAKPTNKGLVADGVPVYSLKAVPKTINASVPESPKITTGQSTPKSKDKIHPKGEKTKNEQKQPLGIEKTKPRENNEKNVTTKSTTKSKMPEESQKSKEPLLQKETSRGNNKTIHKDKSHEKTVGKLETKTQKPKTVDEEEKLSPTITKVEESKKSMNLKPPEVDDNKAYLPEEGHYYQIPTNVSDESSEYEGILLLRKKSRRSKKRPYDDHEDEDESGEKEEIKKIKDIKIVENPAESIDRKALNDLETKAKSIIGNKPQKKEDLSLPTKNALPSDGVPVAPTSGVSSDKKVEENSGKLVESGTQQSTPKKENVAVRDLVPKNILGNEHAEKKNQQMNSKENNPESTENKSGEENSKLPAAKDVKDLSVNTNENKLTKREVENEQDIPKSEETDKSETISQKDETLEENSAQDSKPHIQKQTGKESKLNKVSDVNGKPKQHDKDAKLLAEKYASGVVLSAQRVLDKIREVKQLKAAKKPSKGSKLDISKVKTENNNKSKSSNDPTKDKKIDKIVDGKKSLRIPVLENQDNDQAQQDGLAEVSNKQDSIKHDKRDQPAANPKSETKLKVRVGKDKKESDKISKRSSVKGIKNKAIKNSAPQKLQNRNAATVGPLSSDIRSAARHSDNREVSTEASRTSNGKDNQKKNSDGVAPFKLQSDNDDKPNFEPDTAAKDSADIMAEIDKEIEIESAKQDENIQTALKKPNSANKDQETNSNSESENPMDTEKHAKELMDKQTKQLLSDVQNQFEPTTMSGYISDNETEKSNPSSNSKPKPLKGKPMSKSLDDKANANSKRSFTKVVVIKKKKSVTSRLRNGKPVPASSPKENENNDTVKTEGAKPLKTAGESKKLVKKSTVDAEIATKKTVPQKAASTKKDSQKTGQFLSFEDVLRRHIEVLEKKIIPKTVGAIRAHFELDELQDELRDPADFEESELVYHEDPDEAEDDTFSTYRRKPKSPPLGALKEYDTMSAGEIEVKKFKGADPEDIEVKKFRGADPEEFEIKKFKGEDAEYILKPKNSVTSKVKGNERNNTKFKPSNLKRHQDQPEKKDSEEKTVQYTKNVPKKSKVTNSTQNQKNYRKLSPKSASKNTETNIKKKNAKDTSKKIIIKHAVEQENKRNDYMT